VRWRGGGARQWGVWCDTMMRASINGLGCSECPGGGGNGTTTSIIVDDHRRLGEGESGGGGVNQRLKTRTPYTTCVRGCLIYDHRLPHHRCGAPQSVTSFSVAKPLERKKLKKIVTTVG
jgi:hypothetical protein